MEPKKKKMGCAASRDQSVSVDQSGDGDDMLLPVSAASPQLRVPPEQLVFSGPSQPHAAAPPPSPSCCENSLDELEMGEEIQGAETPLGSDA